MTATKTQIGNATLYCGTMEETIGGIDRIDHVLTDPPYLYIKTHDFDRPWDEVLFFNEVKRLLPPKGFIALFGRGTSFYRWNTRLAELGFKFKEEIIWDKRNVTSPSMPIMRVHEMCTIHTHDGKLNIAHIPYIEQKECDIDGICNDIKRIKSAINSDAGLEAVKNFLLNGTIGVRDNVKRNSVTLSTNLSCSDPASGTLRFIKNGMRERTIIGCYLHRMQKRQHPTEKPVRLAERLLALISDPGDTIYDPFMGSGSFGVACLNTGRKYIGSEMKPEYFEIAKKRIEEASAQGDLFKAA